MCATAARPATLPPPRPPRALVAQELQAFPFLLLFFAIKFWKQQSLDQFFADGFFYTKVRAGGRAGGRALACGGAGWAGARQRGVLAPRSTELI